MCGLFGFINYNHSLSKDALNKLCNTLARESEVRGSHATGISFVSKERLQIVKEAKAAHKLKFHVPDHTTAVMGHTRHSTQGSERKNFNNHPFQGKIQRSQFFSLAHNGVLSNDFLLRKTFNLPPTKIETDSYIAVQLLEHEKSLSTKSLQNMAEQVEGSFTFTLLDQENNLYIVKGDSPFSMIHFQEMGLYVYASTEDILWKAIISSPLFATIKKYLTNEQPRRLMEFIKIQEGEILKINRKGEIERSSFSYAPYKGLGFNWWEYSTIDTRQFKNSTYGKKKPYIPDFLLKLIDIAASLGYDPEDIKLLYDAGYEYFEIEELMTDPYSLDEHLCSIKYNINLEREYI